MYTMVAVLLLLALGGVFFTQERQSASESHDAVESRVRSLDRFIKDFSQDSQRAAYIAGFRTMIAMEQHVASSGEYIDNPHERFREVFVSGTMANTSFTIMENSTFSDYLLKVKQDAGRQGIAFNATVVNITLWQAEPWAILVNYTLDLNVTDARGTASWTTRTTFTGSVPITDLRDPLFTVQTLGRVQRVIRMGNATVFVDDAGDANDTSGLVSHFNHSHYIARGRGPSLLMRFAGNLSDSPYGIESLVDTEELAAQDLGVSTAATVVDFSYFSNAEADACGIQNVPQRLKLADADLEIYQVEGKLAYSPCP